MSQSRPADRDTAAAAAAVAEVVRERRSINFFEPEPVGTEVLLEAIELARWAPNHRLTEPWRFYLIGPETAAAVARTWSAFEAETKGERAGEARLKRLEGIPGHFVLTSRRDDDALVERENYAACCCAVQNLMLYLWARGVGSKWTTGAITREARLYELLGIDAARETIVGYFWYGLAKIVTPQKRKDVAEIVIELP
jgi:nitroreductase